MWVQIALFIASLVISYALQPKPQRQKPAAFEDFDFPTVDDGTPQIVVFGDVWLTDWTVIGVGNYRNEAIVAKQKGLFGTKKTDAGFRYFMSIHMGLCRAIDDMIEIKVSDRSIWTGNISNANSSTININQPDIFGGDKGEGGIQGTLSISRGTIDQPILPQLTAMLGTVPAYRGVVTFFFDGLICSNSPYPKPWSFRVRRTEAGWDGSVWYPEKATIWLSDNTIKAMNAAHILYEAQTNRIWGRGFSASQLDLDSFKSVADQLYSEKFGICLAWRRQENLNEFIQQIINQIGAAMFVDRTTGLWKLVLIRDNYNTANLQSYDYSNGLLSVDDDNNSATDVVTNLVFVTYRDPITNQDLQIRAENLAAIQKHGAIQESKSYAGIPTANLAGRLAARDMKIAQSSLKRFKLNFDRRAYLIQPASVFKVSIPERGIDSIVVRAVRVEHDTVTNGKISVTVVQDIFGLPATNYIKEQPNLWQPPSSQPLPIVNQILYEVPFAELLSEFTVQQLQQMSDQGYVGVVAEQPGSLQLDFSILGKAQAETAFENLGSGDFSFVSGITAAIPQTANAVTCILTKTISSNIQVGDRAFIDNEIVRIESIDRNNNSLTLARGCIDTVPMLHAATATIKFYSNVSNVADRLFSNGQSLNFKLITRTAQGELNPVLATQMNLVMQQRQAKPYPAGDFRINGQYFPPQTSTSDVSLSWSHRNRLMQTGKIPSFIDVTESAETDTTYNLRIFDIENKKIFEKQDIQATNYTWAVPRIFDGEMETVLDIPMTGLNNSQNFVDVSDNAYPIHNPFGTLIKTDTEAAGGSSAFFDKAVLQTTQEYSKLNIYNNDHCIELRVKTAASGELIDGSSNSLGFSIRHNRAVSENISIDYGIMVQSHFNEITFQATGTLLTNGGAGTTSHTISHRAQNLSINTYYDVAVQCVNDGTVVIGGTEITKAMITLYFNGIAVKTDMLHILSWGYPCSLAMRRDPNYESGSTIAINGVRVTKRTGGRYSSDYTPAPFITGASDPYWSDVVLLIPMNGSDGSHNFADVSISPVDLVANEMVTIKTDNNANGGSVAHFYHPMLIVESQNIFNLRDRSFIIEGRVKCEPGQFLKFTSAMALQVGQYELTLSNFDLATQQTISVGLMAGTDPDWAYDKYFNFKIIRDASSGITTLWFNDKNASGQFNPSANSAPQILLGFAYSSKGSWNGFRIQTADSNAELIANVKNPVRIELESERDGLPSFQAVTATIEVK
ncbi:phage tail protein [Acinetobacter ursingii]|uniref:hypothetical protein n=1 Tax=Acinetobacter ursingii TaxID=108980 RepID=UPI0021CDC911|nr:hypothetical protein [Acinetobacter ursingii]MCU4601853.1 hypothetical protein [Acinetobacter ursingii]